MNSRREDTLEDYAIKLAMEQALQSEQRLQLLDLKFDPQKRKPRSERRLDRPVRREREA